LSGCCWIHRDRIPDGYEVVLVVAYDLFISYARKDNQRPGAPGAVTALIDALMREHRRFTTKELVMFFDKDEIRVGQDWELRLQSALRDSKLLLAILSPRYFASQWCHREWKEFSRHEVDRALAGEGIYPVSFEASAPTDGTPTVPGMSARDVGGEIAPPTLAIWSADLHRRNHLDFHLLFADGLEALARPDLQALLEQLDQQIDDRIMRLARAQASPGTVDQHNTAFVGRRSEILRLRRILMGESGAGSIAVIHGLGGMGKSALATEYAHAFAAEYAGGRWLVPCARLTDLAAGIVRLAASLGLDLSLVGQQDTDAGAEIVLRELERRTAAARTGPNDVPACLVVLDGIDNASVLAPAHTMRLPVAPWLHIVATTRLTPDDLATAHQRTTLGRAFLALDALGDEDAVQLIAEHQPSGRFASDDERTAAATIARELGGFPLAVEAAAIYLGLNPEISCSDFRTRLGSELAASLDDVTSAVDVRHAVNRRENQVRVLLAPAVDDFNGPDLFILNSAALLPADHVPLPWLRALGERHFPDLTAVRPGFPSPWGQLTRRLLGRRLLIDTADRDRQGRPRVTRMHRLVQGFVRERMGDLLPWTAGVLVDFAFERAHALQESWRDPANHWEALVLASCAEEWAAAGSRRALELALLLTVPLIGIGLYREAERVCRAAADAARGDASDVAVLVAAMQGSVSSAASHDPTEGEAALRRSLPLAESAFGPDSPIVATVLESLACVVLLREAAANDALDLLDRADAIRTRSGGAQGSDRAFTLTIQAVAQLKRGEQGAAEKTARASVARYGDRRDAGAVGAAIALAVIGAVCAATHRVSDAERAMGQALEVASRVLPPDHPLCHGLRSGLAAILVQTGRAADAVGVLRDAVQGLVDRFGADYPGLIPYYTLLASAFQTTGALADAEAALRRALALAGATYGAEGVQTAETARDLGVFLGMQRRGRDAEPFIRQALAIQEKTLGPISPEVGKTLVALAAVALRNKRPMEFASLSARARQIFAAYRRAAGKEHPYRAVLGPLDMAIGVSVLGCLLVVIVAVAIVIWRLTRG
jgi:tetratricopeptide (TPR) repeat protein